METLTYQVSPIVKFAGNEFVDVPVILQFEDKPLISVVRQEGLGFATDLAIYHSDGTYLAQVLGERIFKTADGEKAGLEIRKYEDAAVCLLNDKIAFEARFIGANAFGMIAELYTPNGLFVKTTSDAAQVLRGGDQALKAGGMTMKGCKFTGLRIAVLLRKDGSCAIGVS